MSGLLREEAACVWAPKKQEIIHDIWFTWTDKHAIILLECAGEEEAKPFLGSLPLVRERITGFDVQTLRPYDGFDRLAAKPEWPSARFVSSKLPPALRSG